jgi:polyisoprenoid-binding protein YceI
MTFLQHRKRVFTGGAAVVIVALAAIGVWYHFYGDDAPPPVSIDDAAAAVDSSPTATTAAPTGSAPATGIDGEWAITEAADSFIGYRIGQELIGVGAQDVVGRTSAVEGSAIIAGSSLTSASVTADMTQLDSGESLRDQTLRGQALQTGTFPSATFELSEPLALPASLAEGQTISVMAHGTLTLHGATQAIAIPLDAQLNNDILVVVGSHDIALADYAIEPPSAPVVASVDDHGVLEVQLFFSRAG